MNAINDGLQALTCGIGALAITAALSWSFIQSTAAAPGTASASAPMTTLTVQHRHIGFGQSRPAVLVD